MRAKNWSKISESFKFAKQSEKNGRAYKKTFLQENRVGNWIPFRQSYVIKEPRENTNNPNGLQMETTTEKKSKKKTT